MHPDEQKSTGIYHHKDDEEKQLEAPPWGVTIGIPLLFGVACFIAFRLFLLIGNLLKW